MSCTASHHSQPVLSISAAPRFAFNVLVYEQTLFQVSYNLHHRVKHDDTGGAVWFLALVLFLLTGLRVTLIVYVKVGKFWYL